MTQQEQLIAKIFDNSVNALGMMAKKISDSIEKEPSKQQLLDDFAKAAMQGIVANSADFTYMRPTTSGQIAMVAYDIAEAMMNERERRMKG